MWTRVWWSASALAPSPEPSARTPISSFTEATRPCRLETLQGAQPGLASRPELKQGNNKK